MNGLIMAAQMIVGLGFLVFIHEGGHFIAARCFGIRVTKFYLFFDSGFSLFKCKKINGKLRFKLFSKNLPDMEEVKDENGDICYVIGILKSIRKQLDKYDGDTVEVQLCERE